jgi:hypothetical protein
MIQVVQAFVAPLTKQFAGLLGKHRGDQPADSSQT